MLISNLIEGEENIMLEEQLRVAIYCRVSTKEQAEEGYSVDEQERIIREFCEKQNFIVVSVYSDRGISGKNIVGRPALKKLLDDASNKNKIFDMVMVWKINRISRKVSDTLKIAEILEKNNITFKSYSENFENTTPAGKMQFQMMAMVAEFERGTIAQNVKMGMMARAREGRWCGNKVLGYDIVEMKNSKSKKRKETELIINENEAKIVRTIFQEYANGKGYKAIVNMINHLGYKSKKGNSFSVQTVKEILMNPVYIGKIRYNLRQEWSEKRRKNINPNPILVDGIHKPIIDMDVWNRVQVIFNSKKGKPSRIYEGEHPLTGILKCPVCGAGMVIMRTTSTLKNGTKKRRVYYACGNWKNKGSAVCNSNAIRVDKANNYVFSKISKLLSNDKMVDKIIETINKNRSKRANPITKELDNIKNQINKLEKKKRKLFEAFEEDIIDKVDFRNRNKQLNKEVENLEYRQRELTSKLKNNYNEEISPIFVKSVLSNFGKLYSNNLEREKKKLLLQMLIKEITITKDKEIDSIKINIGNDIVNYIELQEGISIMDVPSSLFVNRFNSNNFSIIFKI